MAVRQRTPALPGIERAREFIDVIGARAAFVASIGRVVPELRGHRFTDDERATVARNVARVRATCNWVETLPGPALILLREWNVRESIEQRSIKRRLSSHKVVPRSAANS
ncbi:MAG TPA: DUF6192 family protein [Kribbella sp.]